MTVPYVGLESKGSGDVKIDFYAELNAYAAELFERAIDDPDRETSVGEYLGLTKSQAENARRKLKEIYGYDL
jgi:hypothetical protein